MKINLFDQDAAAFDVAAGQVIFHAGDTADRMYAVIAGQVDIVIHGQVVESVEAGGVFGEMALIEDRPRNATATVTAPARLVGIDHKRFLFLVQQNPYFAIQLMTVMAVRLRKMDERL
ncbi:MAG: cAMP-binding domain containing protein [Verrucomicrobia bacterium]|jgi:CRP/FNR family transcriptional regulator, cyclic AMP receptor protein|nr:MAG: cAMP-binding domain containing protein [Verrucomicrobiota bacterium]